MNPSETWAETVWAMRNSERVFGERPHVVWQCDPRLHVQSVTRSAFIAGGPTECFSKKMPVWRSSGTAERDLLPIDKLYGRYCAADRRVEIYVDAIRRDAKLFGAGPDELIYLVRLHEYAHAVVHLGVSNEIASARLSDFGDGETTAWAGYIEHRTERFKTVTEDAHELLAQAITYDALSSLRAELADRMREVFHALEKKQPEIYKIPEEVKFRTGKIDWPLLLDAVSGEIDAPKADGFALISALKSLFCRPRLGMTG